MMLEVVVTEIDQFIHRPKISERAMYASFFFYSPIYFDWLHIFCVHFAHLVDTMR
jgi:hypothetical protein